MKSVHLYLYTWTHRTSLFVCTIFWTFTRLRALVAERSTANDDSCESCGIGVGVMQWRDALKARQGPQITPTEVTVAARTLTRSLFSFFHLLYDTAMRVFVVVFFIWLAFPLSFDHVQVGLWLELLCVGSNCGTVVTSEQNNNDEKGVWLKITHTPLGEKWNKDFVIWNRKKTELNWSV